MVERKLRTLLGVTALLVAGLFLGKPCGAADVSSSRTGSVTQLLRAILSLERQVVVVKTKLTAEFETLAKLETRIRDRIDLDGVPRELDEATARIQVMEDQLAAFDDRAVAIGDRLVKIRDAAARRRNEELVRAAEAALGQLAHLQTNIKSARDDVTIARETVRRLWDMLG